MKETGIGNLGVAAMIAGYESTDDISVIITETKKPFFDDNKERLENFISWLLNEKDCAERTFSVHLSFDTRSLMIQQQYTCNLEELSTDELARDRLHCLALSGGLDSLSSLIELRDHEIEPLCSFLNHGQAQLEFERRSLIACQQKLNIPAVHFTIDTKSIIPISTGGWPLEGFKIPARNFTLLAIMDRFIDTDVSITESRSLNYGVYAGEIMDKNHDKSQRFFDEMTDIFSGYNGVETLVRSPVAYMSKVEQLRFLDGHGLLDFALDACRTCVAPTDLPCLNCKPCFNRMLSVYRAGFGDRVPIEQWNRLSTSDIVAEYTTHLDDYTGERRVDIEAFLIFLSDELYQSGWDNGIQR